MHNTDLLEDLVGTLEKAFAANQPALVSLPIDYRENALLSERLGELVAPI